MFSGYTVPPDSKETKVGSSDQEAFPLVGKNAGIVLVSCHAWKCDPTAISGGVDISKVPECHLLRQISFQWGHKNFFKDLCLMNSQPTFLFLTYFQLNELLPYYQKDVNQITLNHATLQNLNLRIL